MNFDLDDDHLALREAAQRFCSNEARLFAPSPGKAHGPVEIPWRKLADVGFTGLTVDTALGGSGRSGVDMQLVVREFGRVLAVGPFIAHTVLGGGLVARCGTDAQRARWLAPMARGEWRPAPALHDARARRGLASDRTQATRRTNRWQLTGRKEHVIGAGQADAFLVLARLSDPRQDDPSTSLFVVPTDASGVHVTPYRTVDGQHAAHVDLDEVLVDEEDRLGGQRSPDEGLGAAIESAAATYVAEAAGVMDTLLDLCTEHLRTREQFGSPLAKFQSLQHRIADMVMATEQIESMAQAAAMAVEGADATQRRHVVWAARSLTARWGRTLAWQAIQLHGAMGMTDECRVGHCAKRLLAIGQMLCAIDVSTEPISTTHVPASPPGRCSSIFLEAHP